jgi:SAM-dependent methyltransferase
MSHSSGQEELMEYTGKELEAMAFAVNYHRWIIDEFRGYLGRSVVEVGAGCGDLTALLLETGVERLHAFEPSTNLFSRLEGRFSGESRVSLCNGFFTADSAPNEINSIIYVNVLEHIADDGQELRTVHASLEPGGHVLIFVPAHAWLFSDADREMGHFRRYSRRNLRRRVEEAGFVIEKFQYMDLAGIVPWYVNFVLLKNAFSARSVAYYDRFVVPPMRHVERFIGPPLGKNLLLAGKKPAP